MCKRKNLVCFRKKQDARMKQHDSRSPFLIGNLQPGDVIHEAEQKSWRDNQMNTFDL